MWSTKKKIEEIKREVVKEQIEITNKLVNSVLHENTILRNLIKTDKKMVKNLRARGVKL